MAALGSVRVWQALTCLGVLAAFLAGLRMSHFELNPRAISARAKVANLPDAPRAQIELAPAAPAEDRLLARLARAETGNEECDLLDHLPASEDEAVTYAITDVLARTRFESVRACAAEALAKEPTLPAQSWLVDLATDANVNVRRPALEALTKRAEAAQSAVAEAAHSEDEDVREDAVAALLEAKQSSAFSLAIALLREAERPETLASLVQALGKSGDARALPVLSSLVSNADHDTHLDAIAALGSLGERRATSLLESLLVLGSRDEFSAAAEAIAAIDPALAAQALAAAEHSARAERRELALSSLVSLKLTGAKDALASALHDDDGELRKTALALIGSEPDPAFEPELVSLIGDSEPGVSRLAVRALARLHTPTALATLERLDADGNDQEYVAAELERSAPTEEERRERRIRNLEHGLTGSVATLARDAAPEAQAAVLRHFSRDPSDNAELSRVLVVAPASLVDQLAAQIDPANIDQRVALVAGLSERADPRFVDRLRAALRDDDVRVQRVALQGLAKLGDAEAQTRLNEDANSSDPSDRQAAVSLLDELGAHDSAPLLERLAMDADTDVATPALTALGQLDPARAGELLLERYRTESPGVQSALIAVASNLDARTARPILDLALKNADEAVVQAALNVLSAEQGPETAESLLEVARDATRGEGPRTAAADALVALGGPLATQNRSLLDSLRTPPGDIISVSCGTTSW